MNARSFKTKALRASIYVDMKDIGCRKHEGFTLGELLVVVAIIGILVAVSIPIFSGQLEKAKLATCQANRRALLAEVRVKAIDSEMDQETAFTQIYSEDQSKYPCPKGGTFSWEDGQIRCSVHDGTNDAEMEAGGQKIKITAAITPEYQAGDTVQLHTGMICKVGEQYYVMTADFTNKKVTGSYITWFQQNVGTSSALINQSTIYSKSSPKGTYLSPGSLYSDGKTVFVIDANTYISTLNSTKEVQLGIIQ